VSKTFAIIRREFVGRVRTRAFVISTVFLPVMMVFYAVVPALLLRGSDRTMRVAMVDATTDSSGMRFEQALEQQTIERGDQSFARYNVVRVPAVGRIAAVRDSLVALTGLDRRAAPESFDGVLVVSDSGLNAGTAAYLGSNASDFDTRDQLQSTLSRAAMAERLERAGVNPGILADAVRPIDLSTTKVSNGHATEQSGAASFAVAYAMGFILYLTVIIYGQQTMTSVIEEKSSRIMEVLASSVRPFQMLMGKILGVGSAGLFQLGIWSGAYLLITSQRDRLASLFGISSAAMQQVHIPPLPGGLLAIFLAYFVLGFLLFGALYAMVGSMCNTVQDAQQYLMFISLVLVMGFFSVFALIKDPSSSLGVTLSLVPFFSQFAMPVRWSLAAVPPLQLLASLGFGVLALIAMAWLAGRIYRTGILMYGKRPSLAEVARWIRAG
jgi:ABC-2 type transport system permease protein